MARAINERREAAGPGMGGGSGMDFLEVSGMKHSVICVARESELIVM